MTFAVSVFICERYVQMLQYSLISFQIAFEGIVGSSYLSDIAIDDVKLLSNCLPQGEQVFFGRFFPNHFSMPMAESGAFVLVSPSQWPVNIFAAVLIYYHVRNRKSMTLYHYHILFWSMSDCVYHGGDHHKILMELNNSYQLVISLFCTIIVLSIPCIVMLV